MRVVHVSPTAFGAGGVFGGGERYPAELARALAAHVDCELVTFGPKPLSTREDGLPVTVLRAFGRLRGHPAHPVGLGLSSHLRGADIVHAHQLWALPTRTAATWTALRRQRLVVTDHGLLPDRLSRRVPLRVDRYLTVSRYSADVLGSPPEKTRVIYAGVDPERYSPDPSAQRSGVLYVGRITPHKGVDVLVRALPEGASLTVVGTSGHDRNLPEREYPRLVRSLARGKDVDVLEGVPDDELPELLRRAQVLVLPSLERNCYGHTVKISELLGLTLLEGMASGTPVIASRLGGMPEVVDDGVTGFLIEPGDADGLRERLDVLLADPGLARQLGDNARDLVCSRFTWDACAQRCLDAYQELARA
jgi:glycosyltransferase involved in cell wall biosynthesis